MEMLGSGVGSILMAERPLMGPPTPGSGRQQNTSAGGRKMSFHQWLIEIRGSCCGWYFYSRVFCSGATLHTLAERSFASSQDQPDTASRETVQLSHHDSGSQACAVTATVRGGFSTGKPLTPVTWMPPSSLAQPGVFRACSSGHHDAGDPSKAPG